MQNDLKKKFKEVKDGLKVVSDIIDSDREVEERKKAFTDSVHDWNGVVGVCFDLSEAVRGLRERLNNYISGQPKDDQILSDNIKDYTVNHNPQATAVLSGEEMFNEVSKFANGYPKGTPIFTVDGFNKACKITSHDYMLRLYHYGDINLTPDAILEFVTLKGHLSLEVISPDTPANTGMSDSIMDEIANLSFRVKSGIPKLNKPGIRMALTTIHRDAIKELFDNGHILLTVPARYELYKH
jgi:hypothetical protein